ncbi:hypothetical protein RGQ15_00915 [Paracoccus sp. MBLB3053]|uniref:Uncharacterized protein n=1 Tax=Paracoccus aurantius TaxID=3073814 RepID=A0ABU2HM89_9RHOB|nr:hypothetical protein [Paracoccus sp. MBLB3053]MDS9466139.1 hypothetical protein [Paracoccus sp. MBLB3053]
MIGVILWSNAAREKAVIWCDDHAALAYLEGVANLLPDTTWPEAGDLVELEFETINGLRHARRVFLVAGNNRSDLPGLLRDIHQPKAGQPALRVVSNDDYRDENPKPHKVAASG